MAAPQVIIAAVGVVTLIAVAIALIVVHNTEDDDSVNYKSKVTTADGTTYGTTEYDAVTKQASYRGIRYGQAPIGDLRFAPPVKFDYGDVTVDASQFGEMCVQGRAGPSSLQGAEDCLFLNVFVPPSLDVSVAPVDLPVAVWIYGGSYTTGSSNLYPGEPLTKYWSDQGSKTGIVVTLNYRLNVFGFLGSETMRLRDPTDGSTGNAGIQDQRLALQWIQDNIASFGGNKDDVMLFGESAGSTSVVNHMTMRKSFGLYSHVGLQSGSFTQFGTLPLSYSTSIFNQVVSQSSCAALVDAALVQCLSDLSAYDLFVASWKITTTNPFYAQGFGPVVDGVEIKTHPYKILEDRAANPLAGFNAEWDLNTSVDILQGSNQDEGTLFYPIGPGTVGDANFFNIVWKQFFPFTVAELNEIGGYYISAAARALYPPTLPLGLNDFWLGGTRGVGDLTFSCTARFAGRTLTPILAANPAAQGGPKKVFNYFFEYSAVANNGLVPHGAEIPFVFNNPALPAKDKVMADVLSTAWGNFLTTRDPNAGVAPLQGAAAWTQYAVADDNTYRMRDAAADAIDATPVAGLRMYNELKNDECDFWDEKLSILIETDFGAGTENGSIVAP